MKFENPVRRFSDKKQKSEEVPKSKKLRKGALAALALYALPPSDTPQSSLESFDHRSVAAKELQEDGITEAQRRAYKPGISELTAETIFPYAYSSGGDEFTPASIGEDAERLVQNAYEALSEGADSRYEKRQLDLQKVGRLSSEVTRGMVESRKDAWNLYLGLPQEHDTFGISDYRPENSSQDIYYYKINRFLQNFAQVRHYSEQEALAILIDTTKDPLEYNGRHPYGRPAPPRQSLHVDHGSGIMGQYTISKGVDERGHYISYYDRWDLEGSIEGEGGLIGKPYEIYDRIYYDPQTFEVIQP
jgi:hypothetical protein